MSYNIRFDNPNDGENQWDLRKGLVTGLIGFHEPDLLGVQEALLNQIRDLQAALPGFGWYGVGREDGREQGEFSPVFYRKNRFRILDKGTFWLSPTPDLPTRGWDADVVRVCSWVKLTDLSTGKTFYHFNTHLDHMGKLARQECAALLRMRITQVAGSDPVVLTGDFNDSPRTPFYEKLTEGEHLFDAKTITQTPHYGPHGTWATFDVLQGIGNQLDYVFVSPGVTVLSHAFLSDCYQFRRPSDHLPVLAKIRL
jgi:endonuclease/exonuclease/phosphatase family metal-dependent hydrolase